MYFENINILQTAFSTTELTNFLRRGHYWDLNFSLAPARKALYHLSQTPAMFLL
jgi:hypothetical protein